MLRHLLRSKTAAASRRAIRRAQPELATLEGRQLLSGIIGSHIGANIVGSHIGTSMVGQNIGVDGIQGAHIG